MDDEAYMTAAIEQAKIAQSLNEVPIGAVVVQGGEIVGRGYNQSITLNDPTAHAEVQAMRDAARHLGNYRLVSCELFVTLEPCLMCVGAIVHGRIARLVFGAFDPKTGAVRSCDQGFDRVFLNHRPTVQGGVLADACGDLLRTFFRARR